MDKQKIQINFKPKQRNATLDIIKGVAIILVVLGHSIQYGNGENFHQNRSFFDDPIFKIIYSFHMPLFMLISGYLFYHTVNKYSTKEFIFNRINRLLLPIFCWNTIYYFSSRIYTHSEFTLRNCIGSYLGAIWFLWAIFWCSSAVFIIHKYFKDNLWLYVLLFILSFITPDIFCFSLYKYMYPFFVSAYLFKKYEENIMNVVNKWKTIFVVSTLVFYFVLIIFYSKDCYIYTTGFTILGKSILHQIYFDLYRTVIGFAGSILVIWIVNYLTHKKIKSLVLQSVGRVSLGIYIISGYIFQIVCRITTNLTLNYAVNIGETIAIVAISFIFTIILMQNKWTNRLFLGGR